MSKYNLAIKLEHVNEENLFLPEGVGNLELHAIPLDKVQAAVDLLVANAVSLYGTSPLNTEGKEKA